MSVISSAAAPSDLIGSPLFSLLLKGRASSDDLAHAVGRDREVVDDSLRAAAEKGWVVLPVGR
jgi:hypothetical protein